MSQKDNIGGWEGETLRGDLQIHMAAYEALPQRIRELYDSAPIKFDPVQWYEAVLMFGQYTAEERIRELLKQSFPDWDGRPVMKRERK